MVVESNMFPPGSRADGRVANSRAGRVANSRAGRVPQRYTMRPCQCDQDVITGDLRTSSQDVITGDLHPESELCPELCPELHPEPTLLAMHSTPDLYHNPPRPMPCCPTCPTTCHSGPHAPCFGADHCWPRSLSMSFSRCFFNSPSSSTCNSGGTYPVVPVTSCDLL